MDDGEIRQALRILAAEADAAPGLTGRDLHGTLAAAIAAIDARVSAQMDAVLGHPTFRALERAWRGLAWLVAESGGLAGVRVRVLDAGSTELAAAAEGLRWRQTALARKVFYAPLRPGGVPFSVLVLDAEIGGEDGETAALRDMLRVCAAAQTPLIANAAPRLLALEDFAALAGTGALPGEAGREDWAALRREPESAYLAMCLPRMVLPDGGQAGAAFGMAACMARSFARDGVAGRYRGPEEGRTGCTAKVALTDREEAQLARAGFTALMSRTGLEGAWIISGYSVYAPRPGASGDEAAEEQMRARLPYRMPVHRLAQCVMRMAAGWDGTLAEFEAHVRDWLGGMVLERHWEHPAEARAARPLADALFEVAAGPQGMTARLGAIFGYPSECGPGGPVTVNLVLPLAAR